MRKSFTMIELILVIVISGIIGTAGSLAMVQIMQNYVLQKEYNKLELDSSAAIRQIKKYLQDSIWDSIAIKVNNNYTSIFNINSANNGNIQNNTQLVFIEKNMDSINGVFGVLQANFYNIPIFSGLVDLNISNKKTVISRADTDRLSNLRPYVNNIALYFPYANVGGSIYDRFYNTNESKRTSLFTITRIITEVTMELRNVPKMMGDIALIANTRPTTLRKDNNDNLILVDSANQSQVLLQNVSSVKIWSEAATNLIRIRICFKNKIMDFMPEFCKEGVALQ